jgi:hypothetical protein
LLTPSVCVSPNNLHGWLCPSVIEYSICFSLSGKLLIEHSSHQYF